MPNAQPNQEIVQEIYRALVLLGAEADLLGTVGSWGNSLPEADVLGNLKAWNLQTAKDVTRRTEHYEMTFHRPACIPDAAREMSLQAR
ncbi:MAG TPA: hypothetical protein VK814_13755 [Acidobacteriaceae bacterium]|jgi:hypothetical protein|nr:hypothetical protein [Acidobacteriaceae bacterium]